MPTDALSALPMSDAATQLSRIEAEIARPERQPRPVFELAAKWLRQRLPDHLWRTTMDKLGFDQPSYASYRAAPAQDAGTLG